MRHKTSAILLAAAVGAGTAACGSSASSSNSSSTTSGATAAGKGCSKSNPVQIGVIQTLSGPAASIGQGDQDGINLAVQQINAKGGILGRCVTLVTKDDAGDPTQASSAARELTGQDQVSAVIGPLLSSNTSAVLPVIDTAKILEASVGSPPDSLDPNKSPYTFVFGISGPAGAGGFGTCAATLGATKVAVLAVNNALGTDYLTSLKNAAGSLNLQIVASQYANTGTVDLTPQLRALQAANPQALILFNTGADITAALKARAALNWNVPVIGFSTITADSVIQAIGAQGMTGVYGSGFSPALTHAPGSAQPSDPTGAAFVQELQNLYHQNPLTVSAEARASEYDAMNMVAETFNAVHSLNSDQARQYLNSHGYNGLQGRYDFSSTSHAGVTAQDQVCVSATTFKNGTYEKATKQ